MWRDIYSAILWYIQKCVDHDSTQMNSRSPSISSICFYSNLVGNTASSEMMFVKWHWVPLGFPLSDDCSRSRFHHVCAAAAAHWVTNGACCPPGRCRVAWLKKGTFLYLLMGDKGKKHWVSVRWCTTMRLYNSFIAASIPPKGISSGGDWWWRALIYTLFHRVSPEPLTGSSNQTVLCVLCVCWVYATHSLPHLCRIW